MKLPVYYEDPHTNHVGTMPNRAYFIPASRRMEDLMVHRENSDRFQLLNGQWKFCYGKNIHEFSDLFFEPSFQADNWDTISVPGVWQHNGYDQSQYITHGYPFPFDPPHVPLDTPCGAYLRDFVYMPDELAPKAYLNFEGVDSCFYVWLNGRFVGYSQVSHSTSEFDVTDAIRPGKNTLAVLVLKWGDGSYLEDQDKFRYTGIFRDVYILKRPESCIRDYFTTTTLDTDSAAVMVRFEYTGNAVPTKLNLLNEAGETVATGEVAYFDSDDVYTHQAVLFVKEPVLWNPEQPYLYTLVIETPDEVIMDRVGLRKIYIENSVVYLNSSPIKFRGVNRHDSDPFVGPAVDLEHMKRDLRLMRENNFNAIRTSHYPNAPVFYHLCDEYGFMVIDEADNESHGALEVVHQDGEQIEHWSETLSDNPEYIEATVDRVQLCVHRDKNRPCVLIWSMGNESAYGCCFEAALAWTKQFDPSRLTHYEGVRYRSKKHEYDYSKLDLYSRMYPSFEQMQTYVDSQPAKPLILCEYAHAMGNGPGDMEDYWQMFHTYPVMCGGFIWEWCDHAVYGGKTADGKVKFLYGGDHGEYPESGNFCMDGLVYPDRKPHNGLLEFKNVHRPARVTAFDQDTGTLTLYNYMDFVSLNDYLTIRYEVYCDGETISAGEITEVPVIAPHAEGTAALAVHTPEKGSCYLKVSYFLKNDTALLNAGHSLGFDEIKLRNADERNQKAVAMREAKGAGKSVTVTENGRYLDINGDGFSYRYDTFTGCFHKMSFRGKELLEQPMGLNIWRAPTDNDRNIKLRWMAVKYDRGYSRTYETRWETVEDGVRITSTGSMLAPIVQPFMTLHLQWTVSEDGALTAQIHVKRNLEFLELPRFGLRLFLPRALDQVIYYGLGPMENYIDKRQAAYHGLFRDTVMGLHEDYIRPQENGARSDCEFVTLESDELRITVVGFESFSFNASCYTQEELTAKNHNFELEESGHTVLCLDYRHNGIGSDSCGHALLEKYRLDEENMEFMIRIIPEVK